MVAPHLYGSSTSVAHTQPAVRRKLASLSLAIAAGVAIAAPLAGCGDGAPSAGAAAPPPSAPQAVDRLAHHPHAVDPSAGLPAGSSGVVADAAAGAGATSQSLPQPQSDAEIRRELAASGIPAGDRASLTPDGLAVAPLDAPPVVQAVIQAGNQIARLSYRYGGGHATWIDTAYDCSASISFAFAAAGLISAAMVSGDLARWGDPGPGTWITVFANGGHTFMYVAGLRFDTGGLRATGSRWQATSRSTAGFAERHPPGL